MATATNKKSAAKGKPAAPKSTRAAKAPAKPKTGPAPTPAEDDDGPERSSPALAEVDAEVLEFIAAIDRFKKANGRPFPSWSEVLLIVRQLGYQRR
ncbi:MAG: hypothetical protein MUC36_14660 [Planctomycetes bacterium]|jgi:hypothetical protein|nr:hypothetical protein [Planctomycetota bacterium]